MLSVLCSLFFVLSVFFLLGGCFHLFLLVGVLSFVSSCAKCGKSVVSGCSGGEKSKVEKVLQRFTIRDYKEYM